jgi:hypothetical protein
METGGKASVREARPSRLRRLPRAAIAVDAASTSAVETGRGEMDTRLRRFARLAGTWPAPCGPRPPTLAAAPTPTAAVLWLEPVVEDEAAAPNAEPTDLREARRICRANEPLLLADADGPAPPAEEAEMELGPRERRRSPLAVVLDVAPEADADVTAAFSDGRPEYVAAPAVPAPAVAAE